MLINIDRPLIKVEESWWTHNVYSVVIFIVTCQGGEFPVKPTILEMDTKLIQIFSPLGGLLACFTRKPIKYGLKLRLV